MVPEAHRLRFLFQGMNLHGIWVMILIFWQKWFDFSGKLLYMWMFLSVLYMTVRPFVSRPILYNTVVSAFIGPTMITNNPNWVGSWQQWLEFICKHESHKKEQKSSAAKSLFRNIPTTLWLLPIHNLSVCAILLTLYPFICYRIMIRGRIGNGGVDETQIQVKVKINQDEFIWVKYC